MKKIQNTVLVPDVFRNGKKLRHIWVDGFVMQCFIIYPLICLIAFNHKNWIAGFLICGILITVSYAYFEFLVVKKRNVRAFINFVETLVSSRLFFVSAFLFFMLSNQPWITYIVWLVFFSLIEFVSYQNFLRENKKSLSKISQKHKLFLPKGENIYEYKAISLGWVSKSYDNKNLFDIIINKWVVFVVFLVAFPAQYKIYGSEDFYGASFLAGVMLMALGIAFNQATIGWHIAHKIVRMKERGEL